MSRKKKNGPASDEKEVSFAREVLDFLKDLAISAMIVFLIVKLIVRPVQVVGHSMEPTLKDKALGFSNVLGEKLNHIDRFDIVIIYLEQKQEYLVKRVIGLPGDTVSYENGVLYLNGEPTSEDFLDEKYVSTYDPGSFMEDVAPVTLGDDEYFCLGDNRPHSTDSRYYGPFAKDQIVAKGIFIFYPFNDAGVHTW